MSGDAVSLIVPNRNMAGVPLRRPRVDRAAAAAREGDPAGRRGIDRGDSAAIAADWRARGLPLEVIVAPGANPAQARNAGLAQATGDVIGFLDADDLFPAGKLAAQLARLESEPWVDVVSGIDHLLRSARPRDAGAGGEQPHRDADGREARRLPVRREVFDRIGVLDETQLYSEDTDFILRILEARIPVTRAPTGGALLPAPPGFADVPGRTSASSATSIGPSRDRSSGAPPSASRGISRAWRS